MVALKIYLVNSSHQFTAIDWKGTELGELHQKFSSYYLSFLDLHIFQKTYLKGPLHP